MACECTTEIEDAVTTIITALEGGATLDHTELRDSLKGGGGRDITQVYDHVTSATDTITTGVNALIAWDNDKGPVIDNIPGEFSTLTTFVGAETTAISNQLILMQSNLNESIEVTEDNTVTIINTSIPGAITSIEESVKGGSNVDITQCRDSIKGGNAKDNTQVYDHVTSTTDTILTRIAALSDQVAALSAVVTGLIGGSTIRDWTVNP